MITMSSLSPPNDDCVLLTNIHLNPARISHILERRFTSNSNRTSFDFKAFRPEQPSNNAKVSRSLLRFHPNLKIMVDGDEHSSPDSSSSDEEEDQTPKDASSPNDDNYLNELAEWEPNSFLPITADDDDEEEDDEDDVALQSAGSLEDLSGEPMEISADISNSQVDDIHVTYVHRPIKPEPAINHHRTFTDLPQLDGQIDLLPSNPPRRSTPMNTEEHLNEVLARIKAKRPPLHKTIELFKLPPPVSRYSSSTTKKKRNDSTLAKNSSSTTSHRFDHAPKVKEPKSAKKVKTALQSKLLKENQCAIRPVGGPALSKQAPIPIPKLTSRVENNSSLVGKTSTGSGAKLKSHSIADQRKPYRSASNDVQTSTQRASSSSSMKKSLHPSQRQHKTFSPEEKSVFDHITIAERQLNSMKQTEQSKPGLGKVPSTKEHVFIDSPSPKSVPTVKNKSVVKPPKLAEPTDRQEPSTAESSMITQNTLHIKMNKKKKKKLKRLVVDLPDLLACGPPVSTKKTPSDVLKSKPVEHQAIKKPSVTEPKAMASAPSGRSFSCETPSRPVDFFDDCIVIDDDDDDDETTNKTPSLDASSDEIQEIQRECYSIAYNIRVREKLLEHSVRSSAMRIKWLFNLEYLLLEHILICHEENNRLNRVSSTNALVIKSEPSLTPTPPSMPSSYRIDPSFISIIIINFIKMFILRNSVTDQQELSFVQFGFTSHLRYLLIGLPTYNHPEVTDDYECCSQCHQYSLMISILFDLLFDLMEHDLCEITRKGQYRSSLIEDDYFHQFLHSEQTRKSSSHRIRFVVYFIELLAMHTKKCNQRKEFHFSKNETKLFQSMEDFIRHILQQTAKSPTDVTERLSICFDVLELCLLFVDEKDRRLRQIARFLTTLCEDDVSQLNFILFNTHLLPDIRLLLINEFIEKRFQLKLRTIHHVREFFQKIEVLVGSSTPMDDFTSVLLRSLFNTYADLIKDIKPVPFMYSGFGQELTCLLSKQLESFYKKLFKICSSNQIYFEHFKRTLILFRLMTCKWNQL